MFQSLTTHKTIDIVVSPQCTFDNVYKLVQVLFHARMFKQIEYQQEIEVKAINIDLLLTSIASSFATFRCQT